MKIKILADDLFQVVAVMDGEQCPAELFLTQGEANTQALRQGLMQMLCHVASVGFSGVPQAWTHEASKEAQIYEFTKGSLRLFYFKGKGRQIAVCVGGVRKSGNKADAASVRKAAAWRKKYFHAIESNMCEVFDDETQ